MKDRRMAALRLSIGRCERLDQKLRRELEQRRQELVAQSEECRLQAERLQEATTQLQTRTSELDAMIGGAASFSLDGFNQARRYLDVVAERQYACSAEMERQQQMLTACEAAVAQVRQRLARNRARVEFFERRVQEIARILDDKASDIADDEAQENALARALRERDARA